VSLYKIANDVRFLGSGPRAGIGELNLPEVQPGSSIMPGRVNPVICESVLMACAQVIGNDATIAFGGAAGNFEINLMMPVVSYNLMQPIELLAAIAKEAAKTGESIREVALRETDLGAEKLEQILDPSQMVEPSADRVGAGGAQLPPFE